MDRCTEIHLWFEETNAKMQKNMLELKAQKNRTRCQPEKLQSSPK